jgi:hypothetical protein
MKEIVRKVKLTEPINANGITIMRDHYFSNAYVIDLPMEFAPDHVWQDIFEREWKSSRHLWDRKLFIIGDRLRLLTMATDVEDKLDWVKQVIERTNSQVEQYNQEAETRVAEKEEQAEGQVLEDEKATVNVIRDVVRKRFSTF